MRGWIVAVVVGLLMLMGFAPSALAVTFTVDSVGDASDDTINGVCDADADVPVVCTLRAAVEEANDDTENPGADTIDFATAFDGELADTITLTSSLPPIVGPLTIAGSTACGAPGAPRPCQGLAFPAPTAQHAINVSTSAVTVTGLSITNAGSAIAVFDAIPSLDPVTGFVARGNWLGIALDGTAGPNARGIFLDPGVTGATIGGPTSLANASNRNVIGNSSIAGLLITGADDTVVQGNYFGVLAGGQAQAANVFDIKIGGADLEPTDDPATGNVIGGTLSVPVQGTSACDGPCNLISGATGDGIDLAENGGLGMIPAGQTTVQGNYIGLDLNASTPIPNATTGVDVGAADDVSIGTPGAGGPDGTNRIAGGTSAITSAVGAEGLQVRDNAIGVSFGETQVLGRPAVGIDIASDSAEPVAVSGNRIATSSGDGIRVSGDNATISENGVGVGPSDEVLGVGGAGIHLFETSAATVDSNVIGNATGDGILIDGGTASEVTANLIGTTSGGNGGAGVRMQDSGAEPAAGNVIGSNSALGENSILNNSSDAIVVEGGVTNVDNSILRNTGSNSGLFIDLGDDGLGATTGANGNVQAPAIVAVDADSVSGTATPGATVRLFAKTSAGNGEIAGFLGSDVADGGNWEVSFGSTPDFVGATQTVLGDGTSEMSVEQIDVAAPQTTITKAPKKKLKTKKRKKRVSFEFSASEPGSSFECSIDGAAFAGCSSPVSFKAKRGKHSFSVRATDEVGNEDSTPASYAFKVKRKRKK